MHSVDSQNTVLLFLFILVLRTIADSSTSVHNDVPQKHYTGTPIHTFTPTFIPRLRNKVSERVSHDLSENLNNLFFPRNGHGISLTQGGLEIGRNGFLYERLAPGFSLGKDLSGRTIRVKYTSLISNQLVDIELLYKTDTSNELGRLDLEASHMRLETIESGSVGTFNIPLKRFPGADLRQVIGIRISGQITIHRIDMSHPGKTHHILIVDNCTRWKNVFVNNAREMFAPQYPYRVYNNRALNVNFGGGGDTVDMMSYPFQTARNYAFNITYSAAEEIIRPVQVLFDSWNQHAMTTKSVACEFAFQKGTEHVLLLRMLNVTNVCGIIVHGPLYVHSIRIISLSPYGFVQSKYEDPDYDFGVSDPDFLVPDFDFYG